MSHALYDGLSFEHILRAIHTLHHGNYLPAAPRFALYVQHMTNSRESGYNFWRSVLANSSMTVLRTPADRDLVQGETEQNGTFWSSKVIKCPLRVNADGITQATVFTAASGIMLAEVTKSEDVVFGRVVSGRQCLPVSHQDIVGPCTNMVPTRIRTNDDVKPRELLYKIQDQYLNSLPFETLGLDDIRDNCTDWPKSVTMFGCCTTYQNFEMRPVSQIEDQRVRLEPLMADEKELEEIKGVRDQASLHLLEVIGIPEPNGIDLKVIVSASQRVCDEAMVEAMLLILCERIRSLTVAV